MVGGVCAARFKAQQTHAPAAKLRLFEAEIFAFMAIGSPSWESRSAPYHGTNLMVENYKHEWLAMSSFFPKITGNVFARDVFALDNSRGRERLG